MVYLSKIYKLSLEVFLGGDPSSARLSSASPTLPPLPPLSVSHLSQIKEAFMRSSETVKHFSFLRPGDAKTCQVERLRTGRWTSQSPMCTVVMLFKNLHIHIYCRTEDMYIPCRGFFGIV